MRSFPHPSTPPIWFIGALIRMHARASVAGQDDMDGVDGMDNMYGVLNHHVILTRLDRPVAVSDAGFGVRQHGCRTRVYVGAWLPQSKATAHQYARWLVQNNTSHPARSSCMSHGLTYGIAPYLQSEPVYPQSSGSTSMMRAIEERLRRQPGVAY